MIIGHGGGKDGGGGGATEAANTLRSQAFAKIIDAISEGEIEGLVDGAKSILIDGSPLQNANGEYNFKNVTVDFRNGTQGQTYIAGFSDVENEISVGVQVLHDTPVVRTISDANIDSVRVKLTTSQLTEQNTTNGNLNGSKVAFAIDIQSNGGGYVEAINDSISGKTTSRYERAYRIPLVGAGPWNVRVRRITADSTSSAIQNSIYFSSMTEVVDVKLAYPNTALVGIQIDSSQFSSIPTRAYDVKLLRIRVPTNYNPVTRVYTGVWDGSFKIAWSNNPAWCFYDLIANERYGLGKHIQAENIDKWALYGIGKYCDEPVSDGFGGTEPRFTLNCYLQTRAEAFKVLSDMVSVFRGMTHWSSGGITTTQDAPADPTYLYTNANVINGEFSYSGTSMKARHTVALVSWSDTTDQGRQKIEYVENPEGIAKYGVIQTEITAFGCTSRAQAHRLGRWILLTEQNETETASFRLSLEGAIARPGQIVKVRDNHRFGERCGGRILSSTTNSITLDAPVKIEADTAYTLSVMLPDGTTAESVVVNAASLSASVITLATPFSPTNMPVDMSVWVLTKMNAGEDRLYRVITATESTDMTFALTALRHDNSKYTTIDQLGNLNSASGSGGAGVSPNVSVTIIDAPTGIKTTPVVWMDGATAKAKLLISWKNAAAVSWEVEYSKGNENPTIVTGIVSPAYEIADVGVGYCYVRVRAKSLLTGKYSIWSVGPTQFVSDGKPADPVSLEVTPGFLQVTLKWAIAASALTVASTEIWCSETTSVSGATRIGIVSFPDTVYHHTGLEPGVPHTYWIRLVNHQGVVGSLFPTNGVTAAANVDVTPYLDALHDSFVGSSFYGDLSSRIDLVTAPDLTAFTTDLAMLDAEMIRIRNNQDDAGEAILKTVVVGEEVRSTANAGIASINETVTVLQDSLAIEVTHREVLDARVGAAEASVATESSARATADTATAVLITGLQSTVATNLTNTNASIASEASTRATAVSAVSATATALSARLNTFDATGKPAGSLESVLATEQTTRATADSTNATSITQVTSRLDNAGGYGVTVEQKFTTEASKTAGLQGQYTVKIDNNGNLCSFGLASTAANDNARAQSQFAVVADRFIIAAPPGSGGYAATPFQVVTSPTTLNGQSVAAGVYMDAAYIKNGFITAAKIGDLQVTTLKLGNQAVTIPVSASNSSGPTSATITSTGAPIAVVCTGNVTGDMTGTYVFATLKRGTTVLAEQKVMLFGGNWDYGTVGGGSFSIAFSDTPGVGMFTYWVDLTLGGVTTSSSTIASETIILLETKK